jgi:hypothetical protein
MALFSFLPFQQVYRKLQHFAFPKRILPTMGDFSFLLARQRRGLELMGHGRADILARLQLRFQGFNLVFAVDGFQGAHLSPSLGGRANAGSRRNKEAIATVARTEPGSRLRFRSDRAGQRIRVEQKYSSIR